MTKEEILKLDSKKHVKIWLLNKLGMSRKEIAEALGTNAGHVGNEIKSYMSNKDKREAAEAIDDIGQPPVVDVEYERQRLINAGMPDVAADRYPKKTTTPVSIIDFIEIVKKSKTEEEAYNKISKIKDVPEKVSRSFRKSYDPDGKLTPKQAFSVFYKEIKEPKKSDVKVKVEDKKGSQSFGERMKEARAKKAAENASKSPEDLEYEKLMRILKSTNSMTPKELFNEFGVRDEQQMYGDAKRGQIFHKEYSQLSENKHLTTALKVLHAFSKVWPIKTTISQKLVSHEGDHTYASGEDTESEYGVSRTSDVELKIYDKKTGELMGGLHRSTIQLASPRDKYLEEAINSIKVYFQDGSTPFKQNVNFSKIIADIHKKAEDKKIADKWKTEKVSPGAKTQAKQDVEIWRQKTLKEVYEWLKYKGFKRNHPYFDKAKEDSLLLREWIYKLVNYPIFYAMQIGYDVDKSSYKDSASITWQITANKWAVKNKFDKEWTQYYEENRGYSPDVNSFVAKTFAKEINPILGTNYSSSGYAYDGSKIGFSVYKQNSKAEKGILTRGAIAQGPSHANGGIKTITPNGPLEIEGGEIVINKEASAKHCEELSKINQSAGGGVAFPCDHKGTDTDKAKFGAAIGDDKLKQGIEIEKEHTDLYDELSRRLEAEGSKMPMGQDEFFTWIAKAHIKEVPDYYELLKTHVEKAEHGAKIPFNWSSTGWYRGHQYVVGDIDGKIKFGLWNKEKDDYVLHDNMEYHPELKIEPEVTEKTPYYMLTKDEVIYERDRLEAKSPLSGKDEERMKDLCRYSVVKFNTLLSKLK